MKRSALLYYCLVLWVERTIPICTGRVRKSVRARLGSFWGFLGQRCSMLFGFWWASISGSKISLCVNTENPQLQKRTLKLGFQFMPPVLNLIPNVVWRWSLLLCFTVVLWFCFSCVSILAPLKESEKSVPWQTRTHKSTHIRTRIPHKQILPLSFKLWLFLSFGTFYHQTCPRKSSFLTRAKK